jgi:hypothetical protein
LEIELSYKTNEHRRLCVKKDLSELNLWIDALSTVHNEIEHLKLIEKQLLRNRKIEMDLKGLLRKNTLVMGMFCKYEQELKTEYEYGKREYDLIRTKEHEKKRDIYCILVEEFNQLKQIIYQNLAKYQRR